MKGYIRYSLNNKIKYGKVDGDKIVELSSSYLDPEVEETGLQSNLSDVKLLAPCEPSKIICVGLNYKVIEGNDDIPERPLLFMKPSTCIIGPGEKIVKWAKVNELTFEGELAVVIGKRAHRIKEFEAADYIFGYTIANDVTARDLQQEDSQWTRSKSFDTFLPLGPVVAKDIDISDLTVRTHLNGELKQNGITTDLIFSVPYLINYISEIMTLLPGDIILTGTPGGYGGIMNPGDKVDITIHGIGSLANSVIRESD